MDELNSHKHGLFLRVDHLFSHNHERERSLDEREHKVCQSVGVWDVFEDLLGYPTGVVEHGVVFGREKLEENRVRYDLRLCLVIHKLK